MYPSFFDVYTYFSGFTSVTTQSAGAGLVVNLNFAIYPVFIFVLFAIEFLKVLQIQNPPSLFKHVREKLREIRIRESGNTLLMFSVGFSFVFVLFVIGVGVPALFGTRILEVLFIGLYPLASQTLLNLAGGSSSRKRRVLIFVIVLLVFLGSLFRYYNQIQRRVILA